MEWQSKGNFWLLKCDVSRLDEQTIGLINRIYNYGQCEVDYKTCGSTN